VLLSDVPGQDPKLMRRGCSKVLAMAMMYGV
jgi:hypothetical protein